jgi:hypothetical protein
MLLGLLSLLLKVSRARGTSLQRRLLSRMSAGSNDVDNLQNAGDTNTYLRRPAKKLGSFERGELHNSEPALLL